MKPKTIITLAAALTVGVLLSALFVDCGISDYGTDSCSRTAEPWISSKATWNSTLPQGKRI